MHYLFYMQYKVRGFMMRAFAPETIAGALRTLSRYAAEGSTSSSMGSGLLSRARRSAISPGGLYIVVGYSGGREANINLIDVIWNAANAVAIGDPHDAGSEVFRLLPTPDRLPLLWQEPIYVSRCFISSIRYCIASGHIM
jgi:hypothetical protein